MPERTTAEERLERILYLLPAASRDEGAPLAELARALDVDPATVLADLEAVTARAWYHPPGGADDLQITLTPERVRVWTSGAFRRPVRLSPREALCLALGLRLMGLESGEGAEGEGAHGARQPGGAATKDLRRRLEEALAVEAARGHEPMIHAPELEADPDHARAVLLEAARDRRPCRMRYLKPDAAEPEERTIHPWALACAEGAWYAIAWAPDARGVRVFRVDRVLEAALEPGSFDVPADFEPADWIAGGRVYRADRDAEARVRYSPRVARWIAEREDVERLDDGSVVVRHRVSDPRWLVRHVLRYGNDAEVVEPEAVRGMVREAVEGMG